MAINPYLNINGSLNYFKLKNGTDFQEGFMAVDLNLEFNLLPFDNLSPFVYAGTGAVFDDSFNSIDAKVQYGLGLEYLISDKLGIQLFAEQNFAFTDELDNVISGKRDDQFYRFGLGLNIYLSPPNQKSKTKNTQTRKEKKAKRKERKSTLKVGKTIEEKLKIANEEIQNKQLKDTKEN